MIHIPDETVERALAILNSNRHARARMAYEKMELARLEREANETSVQGRINYALTHPHYSAFLEQLALVEGEYFEARDERDSAAAVIEAWRTMQANQRAAERVR